MGWTTFITFPFTAFIHVCANSWHPIPMDAQNKALTCLFARQAKSIVIPLTELRVHCVMRGISFFPRQKRWHHWSHLMCALNIRWGRKDSIQEFSTLLWAPGLSSPSQTSRATLRTRIGWNQPPSPQQQHKQSQLWVHWLETKQTMIAKPSPACDLWAAATAVRLLHPALRCYSKIPSTETRGSPKLTTLPDEAQHIPMWSLGTWLFLTVAFNLLCANPSPLSFFPLAAFCISILRLIHPVTHSLCLPLFFEPRFVTWPQLHCVTVVSDGFHLHCCLDSLSLKANK